MCQCLHDCIYSLNIVPSRFSSFVIFGLQIFSTSTLLTLGVILNYKKWYICTHIWRIHVQVDELKLILFKLWLNLIIDGILWDSCRSFPCMRLTEIKWLKACCFYFCLTCHPYFILISKCISFHLRLRNQYTMFT